MPSENEYRRDLAERMEERRRELRLRWQDVADAGRVSLRALQSARVGTAEIRPLTQRGIEDGLQWPAGYIYAVLRGKTPPGPDGGDARPPAPASARPEPAAPESAPEDVRLPRDVAAQMEDVALRSIAPEILAQVQSELARNPHATGREIFPNWPKVAEVWDLVSPLSLPEKVVYAATARLRELREEWRDRRSG